MGDKNSEYLCGLMDGELGDSEACFLIKRLGRDAELAARWERYHLARSVVRKHLRINLRGFAARVSGALEADSPASAPATTGWQGWLKPAAGMALAASVAVAVFNIWQGSLVAPDAPLVGTRSLAAATVADPDPSGLVRNAAAQVLPPNLNPKLQAYLIRHNEATALGSSQALAPYWNLVVETPTRVSVDEEAETQPPAVGK